MPHQCLKCGSLFPEGTTTILRGCPDCYGTRFFYTEEPLTMAERDRMLQQANRELPALLEKLAKTAPTPTPAAPATPDAAPPRPPGQSELLPDGRLLIRVPRELKKRMERAVAGWDYDAPPSPAAATAVAPGPESPPPLRPAAPSPLPLPGPSNPTEPRIAFVTDGAPETVRIPQAGAYEIDVRRLLDKSPVVVQKDGTYLIHLASLFEQPPKNGER